MAHFCMTSWRRFVNWWQGKLHQTFNNMAAWTRAYGRVYFWNSGFRRLSLRQKRKGKLLKCQVYAAMYALGDW